MRIMLRFTLPVEKSNAAINDGSLERTMESILSKLKPEEDSAPIANAAARPSWLTKSNGRLVNKAFLESAGRRLSVRGTRATRAREANLILSCRRKAPR